MRRTAIFITAALGIALIVGAFLLSRDESDGVNATLSVAEAMGGDTTGYARAQSRRVFSFPEDHGPHPEYKTEWWYFTGNLTSDSGRRFGYQFTIFRIALTPDGPDSISAGTWETNQLYMGHFTVTDVEGDEHHAFERLSRGAAGLAGAKAEPFRVWLENWSIEGTSSDAFPAMRVRASDEDAGIDIMLKPLKPVVLQGDQGFDRKGPEPGNASYYYSLTRMQTDGSVRIGEEVFRVSGLSWMDREWSTSALGENQIGWDWFSLHLSNGWDLMYYQIREEGGTVSPFSSGVLVSPEGVKIELDRDDVGLDVLDRWKSPDGGVYPVAWRLRVPGEDLDLNIRSLVEDQELNVAVRYWEGAVDVEGTAARHPIKGSGYVELTGYADGEQGGGRSERREAF